DAFEGWQQAQDAVDSVDWAALGLGVADLLQMAGKLAKAELAFEGFAGNLDPSLATKILNGVDVVFGKIIPQIQNGGPFQHLDLHDSPDDAWEQVQQDFGNVNTILNNATGEIGLLDSFLGVFGQESELTGGISKVADVADAITSLPNAFKDFDEAGQ